MFKRIDLWFLNLYTRFAYWFQRTFGKSSYFLAKICALICVLIASFDILDYWFIDIFSSQRNMFWVVIESGVCFSFWIVIFSFNRADERFKEGIVRPYVFFDIKTAQGLICGGFVKFRLWILIPWLIFTILEVLFYLFWGIYLSTIRDKIRDSYFFWSSSTMYFAFIEPLPPDQIKAKIPVGAKYAPNR